MALSLEESNLVHALLSSEQRSIDEILAEFTSKVGRSRSFLVCNSLHIILEDERLLKSPERLIAFAILHQAYSPQPSSENPFMSYIVNAACNDQAEKCERAFILQLLASEGPNVDREFLKLSAANYIDAFDPSAHVFPLREPLQQQYCDKVHSETYGCLFTKAAVKNVVRDPDLHCDANSPEFDLQPGAKPKLGYGDRDETLIGLLVHLSSKGIGPQWMRPHPPILPIQYGELVWLQPIRNPELVWGHGKLAAAFRDLISKALKGALAPTQHEKILVALAKDQQLVYHCELTPRSLPELVENNPMIAVEVLTKMIKSPEIVDYFTVLANMGMSLHSMKVINKLTTTVGLPEKFVHMYIANCISSCRNIEDKYKQNRLIRLFCVFLQSLIRDRIIDAEDLPIQVKAFCNEFSLNREAACLIRLLEISK